MTATLPLGKVVKQVFILETAKGHLRWKVSDLARQCGTSRPLIYYHLGKTKKEILENSIEILAQKFLALSASSPDLFSDEFVAECVSARKYVAKNPEISIFYLRCRSPQSPLRDKFIEIENRYEEKIKRWGIFGASEIKAVHTLLHGMIHSPFASEDSVREAIKKIRKMAGGAKPRARVLPDPAAKAP